MFCLTIPNVSLENRLVLQRLVNAEEFCQNKCRAELLLVKLILVEVKGKISVPSGKSSMLQMISKKEGDVIIQVTIPFRQSF
jgi:hypothetical protein